MIKHIITLSVLTLIIALAGVALAHHPVKTHGAQAAQTMEPILPFDEKLATPM